MELILLLAIAGFIVSLYGFYIEAKLKKDPGYKPICDISDKASCTKPIKSSFGRIFGVSNTFLGMLFYGAIGILACLGYYQLVFLGSIAAAIVSLFLAYILYFKIKTVCLICTVTYFINACLLILSFFNR